MTGNQKFAVHILKTEFGQIITEIYNHRCCKCWNVSLARGRINQYGFTFLLILKASLINLVPLFSAKMRFPKWRRSKPAALRGPSVQKWNQILAGEWAQMTTRVALRVSVFVFNLLWDESRGGQRSLELNCLSNCVSPSWELKTLIEKFV